MDTPITRNDRPAGRPMQPLANGLKTTELWLTAAVAAAPYIVNAVNQSPVIPPSLAVKVSGGAVACYTIARTALKILALFRKF